jgi:predicted nucleic acid-binding protein
VILLAKKKKALFLSDDKPLESLAEMYGLRAWDTWNLLLESLSRNLITVANVEGAVEELGKKKFRLNAKQVAEILQAAKLIEGRKHRVDGTKKKWGKEAFLDSGEATFGEE